MSIIFVLPFLQLLFALKQPADQIVSGFPDEILFEPIIVPPKGKKPIASFSLEMKGPPETTADFIIGKREDLNMGIFCDNEILIYPAYKDIDLKVFTLKANEQIKGEFPLNSTGLYSYFIMSCKIENSIDALENQLQVSGFVAFEGSNGYLPAHKGSYIQMYIGLSVLYALIIYYWTNKYISYSNNIFFCHHCLSALIVATFLQIIFTIGYLFVTNHSGIEPVYLHFLSNLFLFARKTLSRIAILLICSGVQITRKDLESWEKKLIGGMSISYFIICTVSNIHKSDLFVNNKLSRFTLFLLGSLVALNSIFILLIFISLYRSLKSLLPEESFKLGVFHRITKAASIGCAIAIIFCVAEIYFMSRKMFLTATGWKIYVLFDVGFWELLFAYFLMMAMHILSPTIDISNYKQLQQKDDLEKDAKKTSNKKMEQLLLSDSNSEGNENEKNNDDIKNNDENEED